VTQQAMSKLTFAGIIKKFLEEHEVISRIGGDTIRV
jgi:hypothetical protein